MKPLVSVLIPTKNAERTVLCTVQSALSQTYQNIEVICVDDHSGDRTLEILSGISDLRIRVFSQPARGAASARNYALRECTGTIIQFLDADDILAPDKIERQLHMLELNPPRTLATCKWKRFVNAIDEREFVVEPIWADFAPVDWLVCSLSGGWMMPCHAWLTPREVIELAGPWNETLTINDDGDFFCRVVLASSGVRMCHDTAVYYRSGNAHTLSKRDDHKSAALELEAVKSLTQSLLNFEDSARTRAACSFQFQKYLHHVYPRFPALAAAAEQLVASYGGSNAAPDGGPIFYLCQKYFGWKLARKAQALWRSLRGGRRTQW